jgi:hypothetical protein
MAHIGLIYYNTTQDIIQSLLLLLPYTYARCAQPNYKVYTVFEMVHLLQRAPASLASSHHYAPQTPSEQSDEPHPQLLKSLLPEPAFFCAISVALQPHLPLEALRSPFAPTPAYALWLLRL